MKCVGLRIYWRNPISLLVILSLLVELSWLIYVFTNTRNSIQETRVKDSLIVTAERKDSLTVTAERKDSLTVTTERSGSFDVTSKTNGSLDVMSKKNGNLGVMSKKNDSLGVTPKKNEDREVPAESSVNQLNILQQNEQVRPLHDSVQDKRRTIMDSECMKENRDLPLKHQALRYNKEHNLIYCEVPKVGSTFWIRFLHQLRTNTIASPFAIKPQSVSTLNVNDKWEDKNAALKNSTKFLFVRNPFHRLFSAYIDKLFSPNPYYWSLLGKYIIQKFGNKSSICGHDVTFQEFVQYAIHSETTREHQNNHIMSVWQLCSPCRVKYNIIGKMESFKDDTDYIMDKLHLDRYKDILKNMSIDAANDALHDTAHAYTEMRSKAHSCISPEETANRIWTKLKVRGYVAVDLPIPLGLSLRNEKEVFEIFKDANSKSVSKLGIDGLKRQKHAFFQQAFRRILPQTIVDIREAFEMDFRIFGYDKQIDFLHNESNYSDASFGNVLF